MRVLQVGDAAGIPRKALAMPVVKQPMTDSGDNMEVESDGRVEPGMELGGPSPRPKGSYSSNAHDEEYHAPVKVRACSVFITA